MDKISYCRHRFPGMVIQQAVWLYFRFALSYRDVEDMLAERGIDVSYETVRRWALKFGGIIARKLRRGRPRPDERWHLDEVFVSINGRQLYVWRAVDSEGEALDILVQPRRDRKAARKLMRKLLKKQGVTPATIVTDKLGSYSSALRELGENYRLPIVWLPVRYAHWEMEWITEGVAHNDRLLSASEFFSRARQRLTF